MSSAVTPLISMVYFGKNDNYTERFLERFSSVLCYMEHCILQGGYVDLVEINVVDWGSEYPLFDCIKDNLTGQVQVNFIEVSQKLAKDVSPNCDVDISQAVNTGIRRSIGQFVLTIGADQ